MNGLMRMILRVLPLLCAMGLALDAQAYNTTGHFDTIAMTVGSPAFDKLVLAVDGGTVSESEKQLIIACSQLPDMSNEFDAIVTFSDLSVWHTVKWELGSLQLDQPDVEQMLITQHLIHGLTGGSPVALQNMAVDTVSALFDQWLNDRKNGQGGATACALGMSLHLYGDSYAHRRIIEGDVTGGAMYSTGLGHASPGHYPDWVMCEDLAQATFGGLVCGDPVQNGRAQTWINMAFHAKLLQDIVDKHPDVQKDKWVPFNDAMAELNKRADVVLPDFYKAEKASIRRNDCESEDECQDLRAADWLASYLVTNYFKNWKLNGFANYNYYIQYQHSGIVPEEYSCELLIACLRRLPAGMDSLFAKGGTSACQKTWQIFSKAALGNMRHCATADAKASCVAQDFVTVYRGGTNTPDASTMATAVFPTNASGDAKAKANANAKCPFSDNSPPAPITSR